MIRKSLSLWSLIIIFSSNIVLPMETGSSQQSGRSSDYRLLVAARKRTAQAIRKIGLVIAYKDLQEDTTAFYILPQELRMRSMVNANQEFCQALKRIESEPSFQSLSVEDQQNKRTELAEKDAVRLQLSRNMTYETNDMSSADRFNLATRRIGLLVEYIMLQEHIDIEDLEAERIAEYELSTEIAQNSRECAALELAENKLSTEYLSKIRASVYPQSDLKDSNLCEDADPEDLDDKLVDLVLDTVPTELDRIYIEIVVQFERLAEGKNVTFREKFRKFILAGPSGTGKSLLGEAMAKKTKARCRTINCDKIANSFIKSGTDNLDLIFGSLLKSNERWIVIVDEMDKIDPKHYQSVPGSDPDGMKTFDRILKQLEKLGRKSNIVLIGTTNHIDSVPESTKSRFGNKVIDYPFPDEKIREKVLEYLINKAIAGNQLVAVSVEEKLALFVKQTKGYSIRKIVENFDEIISQDLACQIYAQYLEEQKAAQAASIEETQGATSTRLSTATVSENTQAAQVSGARVRTTRTEQGSASESQGPPIRASLDSLSQGFDRLNYRTWGETFSGWWNGTKKFCRENPVWAPIGTTLGLAAVGGVGLAGKALHDKYGFTGKLKRAKADLNDAQTYSERIHNRIANQGYQHSTSLGGSLHGEASYTAGGSLNTGVPVIANATVSSSATASGGGSISASRTNQRLTLDQTVAERMLADYGLRVADHVNSYPALSYALDRLEARISRGWGDIVEHRIPDTTNLSSLSTFQDELDKLGL